MNKSTTTALIVAAIGLGAYYLYTQGAFGTPISPASTILLQSSNGTVIATIAASQVTSAPAGGLTVGQGFSYNGSTYALSQGANGQLIGTFISSP
jgi:hypothetical protein